MRFVQVEPGGIVTLNFMWLPTWIGMNAALKREIEKELSPKIIGKASDEMDDVHDLIVDYLCTKFAHINGLRDYLDGIKFVQEG